jgi:hypothetical protein
VACFVAVTIPLTILQLQIDLYELLANPEHEYINMLVTYAEHLPMPVDVSNPAKFSSERFGSFLDDSSHGYFQKFRVIKSFTDRLLFLQVNLPSDFTQRAIPPVARLLTQPDVPAYSPQLLRQNLIPVLI